MLRLTLFYLILRSFCLAYHSARVLGPIIFPLYTIPLSKVIQNHPGIGFHFFADDTQLYVHLTHKNVTHAFDRVKTCLDTVKKWLSANKLKVNPDKTEFINFGSKMQHEKLKSFPVNILGNFLSPAEAIRNLGTWFDSVFFFLFEACSEYV